MRIPTFKRKFRQEQGRGRSREERTKTFTKPEQAAESIRLVQEELEPISS